MTTTDSSSLSALMPPSETKGSSASNALLLTPEEASRRLSVGRTTIYALMASGELSSVNIGRCRRVPVSSLSLFVTRLIGDLYAVQPRSTGEGRTADAEGGSDSEARYPPPSHHHGSVEVVAPRNPRVR
jgi:excisionase family DNA binding protein